MVFRDLSGKKLQYSPMIFSLNIHQFVIILIFVVL
jgi:hypothetical protein